MKPSCPSGQVALSRRTVLCGLAGASLFRPGREAAAAVSARHDFPVGDVTVTVLSDGTLALPASLVLPGTPRAELEVLLGGPVPAAGFVAQTNVTILTAGATRILIDAGGGGNFQPSLGRLPARLKEASIDPASITHVVFTHGHPDHLWGALDELDEPRFSNAVQIIGAVEWDYWSDPETARRAPESLQGIAAGAARILRVLEPKIERRSPGDAIAPGITLLDTAGHTPGHVSVLVESGGSRLVVGGDVLTHERVSFERPRWEWGTDADPARAVKARLATLDMLSGGGTRLLAYHLPWPGLGRVERSGAAFRYVSES